MLGLSIGDSQLMRIARDIVRTTKHGRRKEALQLALGREGVQASDATMARAITLAAKERSDHLSSLEWGSIVAYARAFDDCDPDNDIALELINADDSATVDAEPPAQRFERVALLTGAGKRMVANGSLSSIVTIDFSHKTAQVSLPTVVEEMTRRLNGGEVESGAASEGAVAVPAAAPGRPHVVSCGLGRIAVVVGRTYYRTRVLLAVAIVGSETVVNATWLLQLVESHTQLVQQRGEVIIFCDRGVSIAAAIDETFPDSTCHVVHCLTHFKRNVAALPGIGDKDMKAKVINLLQVAANTTTTGDFERAMQAIKDLSVVAHDYIRNHEPHFWCRAHMPFNPLNNLTSNDAEGFFGAIADEKSSSESTLFHLLQAAINHGVKAQFAIKQCMSKATGTLAMPSLRKEFEYRCQLAKHHFGLHMQEDDLVVHVEIKAASQRSFRVDLTDASQRASWCSCGANETDLLPCVHVLWAVRERHMLDGDVTALLLPESLLVTARRHISTISAPATSTLAPVYGILAPQWITADVAIARLPSTLQVAVPQVNIAKYSAGASGAVHNAPFMFGSKNSRVRSTGELDMLEIARHMKATDEKRKHVRIRMSELAAGKKRAAVDIESDNDATNGDASGRDSDSEGGIAPNRKKQRKCKNCGEPGHYQRTCKAPPKK